MCVQFVRNVLETKARLYAIPTVISYIIRVKSINKIISMEILFVCGYYDLYLQHAMPPNSGEACGMNYLNPRFPLPSPAVCEIRREG